MSERNLIDGLKAALAASERAGQVAVARAGLRLMNDAIMEINTVPLDEGTLRGSASLHVNGKLASTSPNIGGQPTPNTDSIPGPPNGVAEAVIGFNTPYAAYQHEGARADGTHIVRNYTEPSSGPKFLESKRIRNRERYLKIMSREFQKEIERHD